MLLQTEADNKVMAELSDPFASGKLIHRLHPTARRTVSHMKGWITKKLMPAREKQSTRQWSPFVTNFVSGATQPLLKKALMTYVSQGFYQTPEQLQKSRHSNQAQAVEIANAFNRLGYSVDIVDLWDSETVPQNDYDVFFGEHENFGRFLPILPKETLKIFYGTRSYWSAEHDAIRVRAQRIKQARGNTIPIKHWEQENSWVQQADAVIAIGNEATVGTFNPYHSRVYAIDNSALPLPAPALEQKDFVNARKNFLWLGSGTLLRKGLDLVLEAFARSPELHLWICGPLEDHNELEFLWAYRRELFHTPNIHPVGMVEPQSETLKVLVEKCAALIFTSCSEGMSGGVLDCMAQGLIPIVSTETGIDTDNLGVTLEQCSVETIRTAIQDFANIAPEECRRMAGEAYYQTQTRYSLMTFRSNIERLLRTVIAQNSENSRN